MTTHAKSARGFTGKADGSGRGHGFAFLRPLAEAERREPYFFRFAVANL
jgi:hypothetical protein